MKKLFYGAKISDYGTKHGFVDMQAFCEAIGANLNTADHTLDDREIEDWVCLVEPEGEYIDADGYICTYEDFLADPDNVELYEAPDPFRFYTIDARGAEIVKKYQVGYLWFDSSKDDFVWGIQQFALSYEFVDTGIKIKD